MPVTLTITDTAYRGNGVGRMPDGKALFVPYTVTGDEITADIVEDKGSYAVGMLRDILKPSDWRTEPHCPYHGICGGCHFGHIQYEKQLGIKKNILLQALRKHPQHESLSKSLQIFSAEPLGYRVRASIRVLGKQTGFFKNNSNDFIAIDKCPVISPSLWVKCRHWADSVSPERLTVLSVMKNPEGKAIALAEGAVLYDQGKCDGISNGKQQTGLPYLEYKTPAGIVPVAYGGFFQSNAFLNDTFQSYAASLAGDTGRILELYAGSGFFTAALMHTGATVEALELNAIAATLGRAHNYPIKSANVSEIQKEKAKYDLVFMDPPRDGVDKKTLAVVQEMAPARIIYVSCNPMTAARDLQRLEGKYRIASMALFDMFPQTYHVETVSLLQRL